MTENPKTEEEAREILTSLLNYRTLGDFEILVMNRALRVMGVPINERGYVWPIEGRTKEQEIEAWDKYRPLMKGLMARHANSLDKSARPLPESMGIQPERGRLAMSQSENKRYDKCSEAEVLPNADGTVRIYLKNNVMSLDAAKKLAESLTDAAKDGEAGAKGAKKADAKPEAKADAPAKAEVKAVDTDKATPVPVKAEPAVKPSAQVEAKIAAKHEANAKAGNNGARSAASQSKSKK